MTPADLRPGRHGGCQRCDPTVPLPASTDSTVLCSGCTAYLCAQGVRLAELPVVLSTELIRGRIRKDTLLPSLAEPTRRLCMHCRQPVVGGWCGCI